MTMTSLLWRHLYLEHSQSVHYFARQFSFATCQVLNCIASYEKREQVQQANVFKRQTLTFDFSTYCPNSCKHLSHHTPVRLYERIDCCDCYIGRQNNTATSVFLINNTFVTMSRRFTPNRYCWSHKRLSPYTGRISDWMAFALRPFAHRKQQNAAHYGILLAGTLPYLMFINDVTVTSSK